MYSCAFIGHRNCPDHITTDLLSVIENLIVCEKVDTFFVGTEGRFDYLVYKTLCELEKVKPIKIHVVLPYLNPKNKQIYYDPQKTIFPDCLTKTPPRFAIRKRNDYLLQITDFLICYLDVPFSNTYFIVKRAIKKNIKIINVGNFSLQSIKE